MSEFPPPEPLPPAAPVAEVLNTTERAGLRQRFKARGLWQRSLAYIGTGFVGLLILGLIFGSADKDKEVVGTKVADTTSIVDTTATAQAPATSTEVVTTVDPTTSTVAPTTTDAPTTTAAAPTSIAAPTTVPGSLLAIDVLALIPVENEHGSDYNRDAFGYPNDGDGDGCNTRQEVLIRESVTRAQVDLAGCQVIAGDWYSIYDATTFSDPAELEIDHVVALKEAWDSGAWSWDDQRQEAFGNDLADPRSLRAVSSSSNNTKGDKDPSNWIPSNDTAVCQYLADWVSIKARWSLSMDQSESGRIRNLLNTRCPGQLITPWPVTAPPTPTTNPPTLPPPPPQQPVLPSVPDRPDNCDSSYPGVCIPSPPPDVDCGDIPYRRFVVLPPDPHGFDGDDDGIGCES